MMDDRFRETIERLTAALRAELERDLTAAAGEFAHALHEERERAARLAAEAEGLRRALADERERAAQQAAEAVAADMRRQAEMQAQVAEAQDEALRLVQRVQREAAAERAAAVAEAVESARADARRESDARAELEIARLREAAQAQAEEIRRSAEAQVADLRQTLHAQLEEVKRTAHGQVEQARRHAEEQIAHARRAGSDEVEQARREAAAQISEAQARADAQIADIRRSAAEQIEQAQRHAEAEIASVRSELSAQIDDVRGRAAAEIEQARTEAAGACAQVEQLRADIDRARADAEEVVIAQLAAAQGETARQVSEAVGRARAEAERGANAQADRLLESIRSLDESKSIGEALDALAECAARHVERAVVLVVKDARLRVRRAAGFALEPGAELDRPAAGLAGAVVTTGLAVARPAEPGDTQAGAFATLPAFAQNAGGRYAAALPISVGGRVVAVLYADAPKPDAPAAPGRWPATLEVLSRHTSRMLEMLTVLQATGMVAARGAQRAAAAPTPPHTGQDDEDAARRYARLLVSEIRMYHEPTVDAGRQSRDLRSRLGGEIDRARRLYDERVPRAVRERSDFFEQELVRTLADGDVSLLG